LRLLKVNAVLGFVQFAFLRIKLELHLGMDSIPFFTTRQASNFSGQRKRARNPISGGERRSQG
jgi:hypothetical protein